MVLLRNLTLVLAALVALVWAMPHGQPAVEPAGPRSEIAGLHETIAHQRWIIALSNRFGFTPDIVILVDRKARTLFDGPTETGRWSYIRSAEALTRRMLSIMWVESRGDPRAVGAAGEIGLAQIKLSTAQMYDPAVTATELTDVNVHINLAFAHFLELLDRNDGDDVFAYLAWNYGERGALNLIESRRETNGYAMRVLAAAR